jgi:hypothetical protein
MTNSQRSSTPTVIPARCEPKLPSHRDRLSNSSSDLVTEVGEGREGPLARIGVTYLERAFSFSSRANVWPSQARR